MSLSTVSATIVDPSGQVFANGTWQLVFKPTPNTPGLFTDGGVPFTTLFSGVLDATGSFSQAGVARNDTIAPAGSKWSLIVSPNANGQAYSIDLNINNGAFNASAAINAIITNVAVQATTVAHAYKDTEVIPVPGTGGMYYDATLKVLKIYDTAAATWITVTSNLQLPITKTAIVSNWLRSYDALTGLFTASQPAYSDISGVPQLAVTKAAIVSNWLRSYDSTTGLFTASQPVYGDISGIPQLPITLGAVASNWLRSYNSVTGLFTTSQPASADISDGTGTGVVARQTSPSFVTPVLGVATATSIEIAANNPLILDEGTAPVGVVGKDLIYGDTTGHRLRVKLNNAGQDTIAQFSDPLSVFSSTTSTQLATILSDETGTGLVVFNNAPALVSPSTTGTDSGSETLQNKRLTPRQIVMADATSVTPTSDTADINTFTSTQVGGTLTVNAPTGTPTDGQKLVLRLKSTNAQTYSFNATYAFSTTVTAPVTLAAGKTDYIGLMWNATNTKWDVVAVDQGH